MERARTDDDHVELEATLQELVLNLRGDAVETDILRRANLLCGGRRHGLLAEEKQEWDEGEGSEWEGATENAALGGDSDTPAGVNQPRSDRSGPVLIEASSVPIGD